MKRTIATILSTALALVMVLSLAACGGNSQENQSSESNNSSSGSSGTKLSTMSDSEKKNIVVYEAITDAERKMKSDFTFDEDESYYKVGSAKCVETTNKGEKWEVSGTLYLMDNYGSLVESATFEYDTIYLNDSGSATSVGHYEINAGSKNYHN